MREKKALDVLKNGGYFRSELENNYFGVEVFKYHLFTKEGETVKGVGIKTFLHFQEKKLLKRKECVLYSTFPSEWELWENI